MIRVINAIALRQKAAKTIIDRDGNNTELSEKERIILGNAYAFLALSLYHEGPGRGNLSDYFNYLNQIIELCDKAIVLRNPQAMCIRARPRRREAHGFHWNMMGNAEVDNPHEEAMRLY